MDYTKLFSLSREAQDYAARYHKAMEKKSFRLAMVELDMLTLTARDLSKFSGEPAQFIIERFLKGDSATFS